MGHAEPARHGGLTAAAPAPPAPPFHPSLPACSLGLDCLRSLEWRGWSPGGEYEKLLVLKNVSTQNIRFKYRLPATKYFSMAFPETKKLSPGMTVSIPITFRPVKRERYDDVVEFTTDKGQFAVAVRALLPIVRVEVPEDIDFGYIPAKETGHKSFTMSNTGELGIDCAWHLNAPFAIAPAEVHLDPGESQTFHATFEPMDASVFVASAVCLMMGETIALVKIHGIGKYPYVSLQEGTADFGEVLIGTSKEMNITLANHSLVPASFDVTRTALDQDRALSVSPARGRIPPDSSQALKVTYTPASEGMFSSESFTVSCLGGNTEDLKVQGSAVGPAVSLSAESLSFGSVQAKSSSSRVLCIQNQSDVPVTYQFNAEPQGVFSFDEACDTVAPHSQRYVTITFRPKDAASYWKRLVCVVNNRAPLFVDLMGTSFNDKRRPPRLTQKHVNTYLSSAGTCGGHVRVEDIEEAFPSVSSLERPLPLPEQEVWRTFYEGQDPTGSVTVDDENIDFGACSRLRMSEYRTVTVTNKTDYKVTSLWHAPDGPDGSPAFTVFPETTDIRPRSQAEFRLQFRPAKDNAYHSQMLDCITYIKSQRDFRMVPDNKLMAPWHNTVQVTGHTFPRGSEAFVPKAKFSSKVLNFPPCKVGESMYLTTAIANDGDTPVKFDIRESKTLADVLTIKPSQGVVPPGGSRLVAVRLHAKEARTYYDNLVCTLNNSSENILDLEIFGGGHIPHLVVDSTLYLKPTCIGASSCRDLKMFNNSKIPVVYEWHVPDRLKNILTIEPSVGMLRGNDATSASLRFAPQKQGECRGNISCMVGVSGRAGTGGGRGGEAGGGQRDRMLVTVVGEGTSGTITMDPPNLEFGAVCARHSSSQRLTLLNQSDGVIAYELQITGPDGRALPDNGVITIDEPSGQLPARALKTVNVKFAPTCRDEFDFRIVCSTVTKVGKAEGARQDRPDSTQLIPLIEAKVEASAAYPMVQITDVFSPGVQKTFLWGMLNVNSLNEELAAVLTTAEVDLYKIGEWKLIGTEEALKVLTPVGSNFGVHEESESDSLMVFELSNTGILESEFKFHFMDDAEVEIENWVDVGEKTDEEGRHHAFLIENDIFQIAPREGKLKPGEKTCVTITYKHTHIGHHELPVLLHIQDGKRVRIHLEGETIPSDAQRLDFPSLEFKMAPVPLGCSPGPIQSFPLFNNGPRAVRFEIDPEPLDRFVASNYGFETFRVLNPVGEVPPNGMCPLQVQFEPIEERQYSLDLPLRVSSGVTHTIELQGEGVHPKNPRAAEAAEAALSSVTSAWDHFSPTPSLKPLSSIVSMSSEHIVLGPMPAKSLVRKLLVIQSSSRMPLNFFWRLELADGEVGEFSIEPSSGTIDPFGSFVCRLCYTAGAFPLRALSRMKCTVEVEEEVAAPPGSPQHRSTVLQDLIVQDPPPRDFEYRDRKRLSVTKQMTKSIRLRLPLLDGIHMEAERDLEQRYVESQQQPHPPSQVMYVSLEMIVQSENQFLKNKGEDDAKKFFTPKIIERLDGNAEAVQAASDLLHDLLLEAFCDPAVVSAIEGLDVEETPMFAQVSSSLPELVTGLSQAGRGADAPTEAASSLLGHPSVSPGSDEPGSTPRAARVGEVPQSGDAEDAGGATAPTPASPEGAAPLPLLTSGPAALHLQELSEFVLESAIFAILQESAHSH